MYVVDFLESLGHFSSHNIPKGAPAWESRTATQLVSPALGYKKNGHL